MTAIAAPSSFQPLPQWNSSNEGEILDTMSAEVSKMFMPRKSVQRTSSSSSTNSSSPSLSANIPAVAPHVNGDTPSMNGEQGGWGRKKGTRGLWPSSKVEPSSGMSAARPQALPTPSSGQAAASTMNSAMHQPSPILPSQNRLQSQAQQNGNRVENLPSPVDSSAVLALLPMTGTFERKQIVVPFFPDVLRIGRQTNAKTVPTSSNGYFDSKVLSRQHAEVWADRNGKIWIRDVKSSNGTFVNGVRLSPENRDSEPHELREQDTLELGIDIVSEDQKSVVHHKVSAKVELAGIYPNQPGMLDMSFGHNDPTGNGTVLGEPMSQQLSQMRGRGGSQGSLGNSTRVAGPSVMAGHNPNLLGPQRQMNIWMGPITIEQVVKKLTVELKQARQQSQDLHHTGDFFGTLLNPDRSSEPLDSPQKAASDRKQSNEVVPLTQLDPLSPFSEPPAPPPQQPLPEKPDVAPFSVLDSLPQPSFRRVETERPTPPSNSPSKIEAPNGHIFPLLEALKSTKKELDSQGERVKYLESALAQERKAREDAERRARNLSSGRPAREDYETNGAIGTAFEPPLDSNQKIEHDQSNGERVDQDDDTTSLRSIGSTASMTTIKDAEEMQQETEEIDASTSRLQARLDLMVKEMDEMKNIMESYKRRAEDAEEGRRSLAEMVENIRAGRSVPTINEKDNTLTMSSDANGTLESKRSISTDVERNAHSAQSHRHQQPNGSAAVGAMQQELARTMTSVLQQQRQWGGTGEGGRMVQSAPYVSMVGVVLIGVGIMTWLNGWQPGGDK